MRRSIFLSQCLDHLIPLLGCLSLLILTPISLGISPEFMFPSAPLSLVASIGGALFVSSLCYRTLCVGLYGSTVGMQLMGLRPRHSENTRDLVTSHVWESLSLACPLLWALDLLARKSGKSIGFDYVFCYKKIL
jgi:hypothetical protein